MPFVEARMKPRHGENWLHYASRAQGGSAGAALDEYGLLKTMIDNWREVFDEAFGRNEKHRVRPRGCRESRPVRLEPCPVSGQNREHRGRLGI
jgi:Swt1-like HEPN